MLSSVNGAASARASTADRLARVAGHDEATGRGGNAVSSCAPVCLTGPLVGAVTSAGRSSLLPELPALGELYPGFEAQSWVGVLGPAGMPREIVARLNAEILSALATDVKERLQSQGYEVLGSTPEAFGEWLRADSIRWGRVIREQRITLD